jgi:hypothetical protein
LHEDLRFRHGARRANQSVGLFFFCHQTHVARIFCGGGCRGILPRNNRSPEFAGGKVQGA